jgi:hypothetical protein
MAPRLATPSRSRHSLKGRASPSGRATCSNRCCAPIRTAKQSRHEPRTCALPVTAARAPDKGLDLLSDFSHPCECWPLAPEFTPQLPPAPIEKCSPARMKIAHRTTSESKTIAAVGLHRSAIAAVVVAGHSSARAPGLRTNAIGRVGPSRRRGFRPKPGLRHRGAEGRRYIGNFSVVGSCAGRVPVACRQPLVVRSPQSDDRRRSPPRNPRGHRNKWRSSPHR